MEKKSEKGKKEEERRKKQRFSVLKELDIPILIQLQDKDEEVEGVLLNISASGIGLISFAPIPEGKKVKLSLKFNQLEAENLEGSIIWKSDEKNGCRMGIKFIKIDNKFASSIDRIAEDYVDCDMRIILGAKDVCFPECMYYPFCGKKEKV